MRFNRQTLDLLAPVAEPDDLSAIELRIGDEVFLLCQYDASDDPSFERLSRAERETARLVVAGLRNAEIAAARNVALSTVSNQLGSIYAKLGVSSRAELQVLLSRRPA